MIRSGEKVSGISRPIAAYRYTQARFLAKASARDFPADAPPNQ